MTKHLIRSRVTKALTDAGLAASFAEAEARLDASSKSAWCWAMIRRERQPAKRLRSRR